jgi:hypothetical protein
MSGLDGVHVGRSGVSFPDTRALHLDPALARGPRDAFLVGTEFAHLHGRPDGSLHVALPPELTGTVIARGWGELHPAARSGHFPRTLLMLYGPRDQLELETIWALVGRSYRYARG